ncbi:hypothetical protein, partial [Vibrio parahaemolyticus]|uniref:hypothetical protein n=1 Tax=Vibrio parahaemolyticus TaxID=670 RepID=UPI002112F0ED
VVAGGVLGCCTTTGGFTSTVAIKLIDFSSFTLIVIEAGLNVYIDEEGLMFRLVPSATTILVSPSPLVVNEPAEVLSTTPP